MKGRQQRWQARSASLRTGRSSHMDILSGAAPLMVDVRQSGSAPYPQLFASVFWFRPAAFQGVLPPLPSVVRWAVVMFACA